jgi:hypothetical protein
MEKPNSGPIIIEQAGMRMTVEHRHGRGGSDEGLTFDITTVGSEDEGKRILRFDCFYKEPHYHVGSSGGENAARKMKEEGVEEPVRLDLGAAQDPVSRNDQTSGLRRNRREDRPASDCRSAHPLRAGNTR